MTIVDASAPEAATVSTDGLLGGYRLMSGSFDEMCGEGGQPRPHWEYVARALDLLGAAELRDRDRDLRGILRENGVTYNVYANAQRSERLWALDPIPVLLTSSEWNTIEQGLIQRAELLDLVLRDLYGPRKLLGRGTLPAAVVYAHPGFLRPCDGLLPSTGQWLHLYAADLARHADGSVCVIGDRAQAPSGMGYALENRTVLSNIFPSLYRDSRVHRLALFFRSLRGALNRLDPAGRENSRVVVLTPGPESETYFEHAYLANHMGYPLVQGSDLGARDGHVWLNTVDGLRPVDVILRRVDDVYCDPLELRPDSLLGVPGVLAGARLGNVALANPLGTSLLDNAGLMAYLPALARELLGEELRLPSVQTWWCGDPQQREHVLQNLSALVIKPIVPHPIPASVFGAVTSAEQRARVTEEIRARPHLYVGQEHVPLSTVPVFVDGRLEARRMVLRAFLAGAEGGYVCMPGGLARVAGHADSWIVSNQYGGLSKDVWIIASEPERQVALPEPRMEPLAVTRDGDDVPGRIADNLFWLGRYSERAEASARLLREVLLRLIGSDRAPGDAAFRILLGTVTRQTCTYPGFVGVEAEATLAAPEGELLAVLADRNRVGSLRYNVEAIVRAARSVRDRLSGDASRVINLLEREFSQACDVEAAMRALQRVITLLTAFAGFCGESMTRGQGWRFLEIGRHLERAVSTIGILDCLFAPAEPNAPALWEALLAIVHSAKTYRRRYRSRLQPVPVLDLILADESNPRSVAYQLAQIEARVADLDTARGARRGAAARLALDALTRVRLFDVESVVPMAEGDAALRLLLAGLRERLSALSNELGHQYFTHVEPPQQLVPLR